MGNDVMAQAGPTVLQTDDSEAVTWADVVPATYVRTHLA